jgi:plastocyanin
MKRKEHKHMDPTTDTSYEYQAPAGQSSRKLWKVLGAVVIVIALVCGIIAGISLTRKEAVNQASAATASAGTVTITRGGSFVPDTIRVKKGQSVTWFNLDGRRSRQILPASDDAAKALPGFGTQDGLAKGDAYTYVFEQTGTFDYHDSESSQNVGTVIVTE